MTSSDDPDRWHDEAADRAFLDAQPEQDDRPPAWRRIDNYDWTFDVPDQED